MKASLPFLFLLGASAASAVPAVPPTQLAQPQRTQLTQPAAQQPPKIPGVSDAGNALFAKSQLALRQQILPIAQQQQAVGQQLAAVVSAPTLDVARFGALLQQRRTLVGQILVKQDEWIVGLLNQMTPADRAPFLKAVSAHAQAGGAAPR